MKQKILVTFASSLILSAMIFCPVASNAGLPRPPLPPLVIPAPPPVFLIPGTYAYFAPDVDADLFFYGGFWYRPYGGRWYRAPHYRGPWGFVGMRRVPGVLINLPPGYRNVPPGHERIPYGHLKRNWKTWERERHWDRPGKRKNIERREHDEGRERGRGR
jgi:hypothetical protein